VTFFKTYNLLNALSLVIAEMRFSWEIKSVDSVFSNGLTRLSDLSKVIHTLPTNLEECLNKNVVGFVDERGNSKIELLTLQEEI
jgi:hypothetical protein